MISIQALDHIVLRAADAEALVAFYRDVIGCAVERTLPEYGLWQLRAGNALIDIVSLDGKLGQVGGKGPGSEGHNVDHFCLRIAPVPKQQLLDYLDSHHISHGGFENRYGATGFGESVYIEDPQGNTVELKFDE